MYSASAFEKLFFLRFNFKNIGSIHFNDLPCSLLKSFYIFLIISNSGEIRDKFPEERFIELEGRRNCMKERSQEQAEM